MIDGFDDSFFTDIVQVEALTWGKDELGGPVDVDASGASVYALIIAQSTGRQEADSTTESIGRFTIVFPADPGNLLVDTKIRWLASNLGAVMFVPPRILNVLGPAKTGGPLAYVWPYDVQEVES
jgi:hypothetical protein